MEHRCILPVYDFGEVDGMPYDVNAAVLAAVQQALFNNVPAQKALDDAVAKAYALIQ